MKARHGYPEAAGLPDYIPRRVEGRLQSRTLPVQAARLLARTRYGRNHLLPEVNTAKEVIFRVGYIEGLFGGCIGQTLRPKERRLSISPIPPTFIP
jgi:hypothetical protein